MKAYLFSTNSILEPFGDNVTESFVAGESLSYVIQKALAFHRLEVISIDSSSQLPIDQEYLLFPDTLFLTRTCIRKFLDLSPKQSTITQLALPNNPVATYCQPTGHEEEQNQFVPFDLFWVRKTPIPQNADWQQLRAFLVQNALLGAIEPNADFEHLVQSRPGPPRTFIDLPRGLTLAVDIHHWSHLLRLNHLLPWIRLQEYWDDHSGLRHIWYSRGKNPYHQGRRLSVFGKNCDIHPTAYVEGSILGDSVKLGPFSSVRDSIIGDHVEVSSHSKFLRCVVGKKCHTLNDSYFIGCTFYPESTLANIMLRNSILGRRCFITSGVMLWDEAIERPIEDSNNWVLGSCAGHHCILGTRAIFLPGKSIPNNTMIVMRPEEGVTKIPSRVEAKKPYIYHQGWVIPLEQALPNWHPLEIDDQEKKK